MIVLCHHQLQFHMPIFASSEYSLNQVRNRWTLAWSQVEEMTVQFSACWHVKWRLTRRWVRQEHYEHSV